MPDGDAIRELVVALSVNSGSSAKDLQGIGNLVKQADAKFRAAAAGVKDFEKSTAGMQAKVAMLNEKLNAQNSAVSKHQAALDKSRDKVQKAADKQKDLATKIEKTKAAYNAQAAATGKDSAEAKALEAELTKLEGQFAANGKSAQRAAQDVQKNETALLNAQAAVKQTAADLEGANKALDKHGTAWAQAMKKVSQAGGILESAGKKLDTLGGNLTRKVTVPILAAGGAAWLAYNQVDDAVDNITKKTGATGAVMVGYEKAFNAVFKDMPFSAELAGTAVGDVIARFKTGGKELENLSEQYLMFADINGAELPASIEKSQRVLAQWGLGAKDAAGFLGLLTKAHQQTGVEVDKVLESLQANGATLKGMNLNLSQSTQLLARFEVAGVNTEVAMAALKKSAAAYAKEGKSLDAGFAITVTSIKNAKTETEALAIAQKAFGVKGALEMAIAIREGRLSVTGLTADMAAMGNVVTDTFNAVSGAPERLAKLKNQAVSLGAQLMKSAVPWLETAMDKVSGLLAGFEAMPEAQQKTAIGFAATAAAAGPALSALGKMATGVGAIMKLMSGPAGWITLGVIGLAGLGIAIGSVKSDMQKLDEKMRSVKLAVDTEDVAQITEDINTGITAAQTVHTVKVSVEADTADIQAKLDTVFADGKFSKGEYKQASKYVANVVNPDIQAAIDAVNEKTASLKAALDGAVNAQGQPLSEAEKTALINEITSKTNTLVTELQTAQTDYENLIKEIYNQRKPATDAQVAALDALLEKIATIRAEIKLANDDAVNMTRADYNKTVAGQGTQENIGGAIGFVQGQQQSAIDDARKKLDTVKATAGAMEDTAAANKLLAAAETDYARAVSAANTEAQKGYQAILDGASKAEGAGDIIATIIQDYDTLSKSMGLFNGLWFNKLKPDGSGWILNDWKTQFNNLFGDEGLGKYISDSDKIKISDLLSTENAGEIEYAALKEIAKGYISQIGLALTQNVDDPKLNPLLEAVQSMMDSGALEGLDTTKFEGALEGIFDAFTIQKKGVEIGTPIGSDVTNGIAAGMVTQKSAAVGAVNEVFTAMIAEANRMRPLLQNAMYWTTGPGSHSDPSGGYGGPGGGNVNALGSTSTNSSPRNYTANANMQIENYNVYNQTDADVLMAQQAARIRRIQSGYGFMPTRNT